MSKTYIVHGTQYFERPKQLTINAPNEQLAEIRANEMTKGSSIRMSMKSSSFSTDFIECIDEEQIVPDNPVLEAKLKKRLDELTNMET
tara:strand:+ start:525 stop:788 length:264 start_codon:yes stop_codon:yes gene_type:complete